MQERNGEGSLVSVQTDSWGSCTWQRLLLTILHSICNAAKMFPREIELFKLVSDATG